LSVAAGGLWSRRGVIDTDSINMAHVRLCGYVLLTLIVLI